MIMRLSAKLAKKIQAGPGAVLPPDPNPFADWSAHLFISARVQYILVTNTASLLSAVFYAKGITHDSIFIKRALGVIGELLRDEGYGFIHERLVAPSTGVVRFSKALNKSVTGSMNDLAHHAAYDLADGEIAPCDCARRLNGIPMGQLKYQLPRVAFGQLSMRIQGDDRSSQTEFGQGFEVRGAGEHVE